MALPASPWRHWRSYGTEPLPTAAEAMTEPMRAFPSWFLKITCDRCGKDRMLNEAHMTDHQSRATAKLAGQRHVGWPVCPASEWV
jgi:hypothetical protein